MPADAERASKKSGETSKETPGKETPGMKRETSGPGLSADLVSFTIDVRSGRIVKLEAVAPGGARRELSREETLRLATQRGSTLADVLERTFEAGITSVLDGAALEEAEAETEDELKLRRLILRPMIEKSAVAPLMKREVLGRAIVGTLIRDAMASQTPPPSRSASTSTSTSTSTSAPASASPSKAAPSPSRSTASRSRRQPPPGKPH